MNYIYELENNIKDCKSCNNILKQELLYDILKNIKINKNDISEDLKYYDALDKAKSELLDKLNKSILNKRKDEETKILKKIQYVDEMINNNIIESNIEDDIRQIITDMNAKQCDKLTVIRKANEKFKYRLPNRLILQMVDKLLNI